MKEISLLPDGRRRVAIESVSPQIDCGRFPIKRVVGEAVVVEANVFADGHDQVACQVLYLREGDKEWQSSPMKRIDAGQDVHVDLLIGAELIEGAARRAKGEEADLLRKSARRVREEKATAGTGPWRSAQDRGTPSSASYTYR